MVRHGTKPNKVSHKDYDFLKSHGFGAAVAPKFPTELLTDSGYWMPNQEETATYAITGQGNFTIKAEQFGCTNFIQADISTDLDKIFKNPEILESITHANANGGLDIRVSLDAALKLGWIKAYYNIRPSKLIEAFDAIRLATLLAQPENRSVSWGTPWFPSWSVAVGRGESIMPMPTSYELMAAPSSFEWHNSKFGVWKTIHGVPYLRNKSLQGGIIGDHGWLYFPREVVNQVMSIKGTVAFTATMNKPATVQKIDVNVLQFIVSYIRHLLGLL